jgi:hypothetical protein
MVLARLDTRMQKMKFDAFLSPYTKYNLKWIKDLNVKCGTVKTLEDIDLGNCVFDRTSKHRQQK